MCQNVRTRLRLRLRAKPLVFGLAASIFLAAAVWFGASGLNRDGAGSVAGLEGLLALPASALQRVEIGRMNLLCAEGLRGAAGFALDAGLVKLDEMAARVGSETERHLYRFQKNPGEFEGSEGFFRMLMLAVVLAEDFGVRYAPSKIGTAADARMGDGFFADAQYVFLQGLVGGQSSSPSSSPLPEEGRGRPKAEVGIASAEVQSLNSPSPSHLPKERVTAPERRSALALGTCSSLPVLQVAVGRRLGYPLKLVATKGHLFVRWEGAGERFNIEAAGQGVNRFTDDYYRHWPLEITPAEEVAEGYLKSLTPPEELAVFLSIRGMCLREARAAGGSCCGVRRGGSARPSLPGISGNAGQPPGGWWFGPCDRTLPRENRSKRQTSESMKTYHLTRIAMPAVVLIAWLLAPQSAHCFYNPSTGRWLSRDPVADAGRRNLDGFVGNDSLRRYDYLWALQFQGCAVQPIRIGVKCVSVKVSFSPGNDKFEWHWLPIEWGSPLRERYDSRLESRGACFALQVLSG